MTHHIRPLEFDASLWRPQNFLFKYLGMIGSWETNSCYLKCLQNWNIHQCLVYYFTVQNNVTGPENTYVSVIGTFSPLPSNTVGSRIKIKNHWFTTRTNGLRREEHSKVHHISTLSSWDGCAWESAHGLVSMETKQGNWVKQSLMYLRKLKATLMTVMSFPSQIEYTSPWL